MRSRKTRRATAAIDCKQFAVLESFDVLHTQTQHVTKSFKPVEKLDKNSFEGLRIYFCGIVDALVGNESAAEKYCIQAAKQTFVSLMLEIACKSLNQSEVRGAVREGK